MSSRSKSQTDRHTRPKPLRFLRFRMSLDSQADTPLLPPSIQDLLNKWAADDLPLWYSELEAIYQLVSMESWLALDSIVDKLEDDIEDLRRYNLDHYTDEKMRRELSRAERAAVDQEKRSREELARIMNGPYRE